MKSKYCQISNGSLCRFGRRDSFLSFTPPLGASFAEDVCVVLEELELLKPKYGSAIWVKFHLSDIATQASCLRQMISSQKFFSSVIGQVPVGNVRLAVEVWFMKGDQGPEMMLDESVSALKLCGKHYQWGVFHSDELLQEGSYDQAMEEFMRVRAYLSAQGGTVRQNLLRTWIYCRDIDNQYQGLVDARNHFFKQEGILTGDPSIASTGIEALQEHHARYIGVDSFFCLGMLDGQIEYMSAENYMSPTQKYGVAFERGTRMIFGDCSLYWISGTASIDHEGRVLHVGDIVAQTKRTIENMGALMHNHQGVLGDFVSMVVYLRDPADERAVRKVLAQSPLASCPYIMVRASVCRPDWLVEIEAIAMNNQGDARYPAFQ